MANFNITGDETSAEIRITRVDAPIEALIIGVGSFGGGTLSIQKKFEDDIFYTIPDALFTVDFSKKIALKRNDVIRYVLAGSTAPNINLQLDVSDG